MTKEEIKQMLLENADEASAALDNISSAVGSAAAQLHDWLEKMSKVQAYALALTGVSIVLSIRMDELDDQPVQFLWGNPKSVKNNLFHIIAQSEKCDVSDIDEEYEEKRA